MPYFLTFIFLFFSILAYAEPGTLKEALTDTANKFNDFKKDAPKKMYVEIEEGAAYIKQITFKMIQSQNEPASPATPGQPFSNKINGWGNLAGIGVGYKIDPDSDIKVSFSNFNLVSKDMYSLQAGNNLGFNPTATSLLPFIDGSTRSSQQAAEIGGQSNSPNALAAITFKYGDQDDNINLDYSHILLKYKQSEISGIVGLSYAYFDQNMSLITNAIDFDNNLPTNTFTHEELNDNLIGLRFGIEDKYNLQDYILDSSIIDSLFYRRTDFQGYQQFVNASLPFTGAQSNFNTTVKSSKDAFTDRLQGKIGISKQFKCIDIGIYYLVDVWFNMSTIVNPTVQSSASHDTIDHPARIGNDNVVLNSVMVQVKF